MDEALASSMCTLFMIFGMNMFRLLLLKNIPILQQLQLEEALLRTHVDNWCLINTGSPPAIVMGISGKAEKLIDLAKVQEDRIPLIKRFSGGGTVYIDPQTIFVTWICNQSTIAISSQPKSILQWSETLYKPLFKGFSLRENDYVFGERKFGGNALYIQKSRWLLHSSLLWDYDRAKMNYLFLPEKRPEYRQNRSHTDFLCTLNTLYPSKQNLFNSLQNHVQNTFSTRLTPLEEIAQILSSPHRKSTIQIIAK